MLQISMASWQLLSMIKVLTLHGRKNNLKTLKTLAFADKNGKVSLIMTKKIKPEIT